MMSDGRGEDFSVHLHAPLAVPKRGVTRVVESEVVHSRSDQSPGSRVLDTPNRQKVPAAVMSPDDKETPSVP